MSLLQNAKRSKNRYRTVFAIFSPVSADTFALIAAWFVDTGPSVLTRTVLTFIDVYMKGGVHSTKTNNLVKNIAFSFAEK